MHVCGTIYIRKPCWKESWRNLISFMRSIFHFSKSISLCLTGQVGAYSYLAVSTNQVPRNPSWRRAPENTGRSSETKNAAERLA